MTQNDYVFFPFAQILVIVFIVPICIWVYVRLKHTYIYIYKSMYDQIQCIEYMQKQKLLNLIAGTVSLESVNFVEVPAHRKVISWHRVSVFWADRYSTIKQMRIFVLPLFEFVVLIFNGFICRRDFYSATMYCTLSAIRPLLCHATTILCYYNHGVLYEFLLNA